VRQTEIVQMRERHLARPAFMACDGDAIQGAVSVSSTRRKN
jgi:hypothetical protein